MEKTRSRDGSVSFAETRCGRCRFQAAIAPGAPSFAVLGLDRVACERAAEIVKQAIRGSGHAFPEAAVTVLAINVGETSYPQRYDLPIAAAVLAAAGLIPAPSIDLRGELDLKGAVIDFEQGGVASLGDLAARRFSVPADVGFLLTGRAAASPGADAEDFDPQAWALEHFEEFKRQAKARIDTMEPEEVLTAIDGGAELEWLD